MLNLHSLTTELPCREHGNTQVANGESGGIGSIASAGERRRANVLVGAVSHGCSTAAGRVLTCSQPVQATEKTCVIQSEVALNGVQPDRIDRAASKSQGCFFSGIFSSFFFLRVVMPCARLPGTPAHPTCRPQPLFQL